MTVTVSDEVFSAVSYLAYARDMDKVEVLSVLAAAAFACRRRSTQFPTGS